MKNFKTLLATATLALAPGLAMAQGCDYEKAEQVTMSCAPGTVLSAETGACVAEVTS